MKELKELEKELNELGPSWNIFGKVDKMKTLIKRALNKLKPENE